MYLRHDLGMKAKELIAFLVFRNEYILLLLFFKL
jgi:hypothetical protein